MVETKEKYKIAVMTILAEEQLDGKLEVVSDKGTTCKVEFEMAEE